jgi:hypothetical protein
MTCVSYKERNYALCKTMRRIPNDAYQTLLFLLCAMLQQQLHNFDQST